jgi:FAD:protein FMN transferase
MSDCGRPAGCAARVQNVSSDQQPGRATSRGTYHPLLGTNVEIRVIADAATHEAAQELAEAAEQAVVTELLRLQEVFSVFDPGSELCRWRAGDDLVPSAELTEVLAAAEHWWRVSGGAFHPASATLRARWLRAEAEQLLPTEAELRALVDDLAELPFTVTPDGVQRLGDCSGVELNAIAKGYIVDRGLAAAVGLDGVADVLVNAGGDLRHQGESVIRVGVEDPRAPGGKPLRVIELGSGALATSGPVHRGFQIQGGWYGHVLDPRTGRPVVGRPSTTVRAPEAITADALATVAGVLDWPEACAVVSAITQVACLAVSDSGEVSSCGRW